jgi:hypothetical protein
LDFQVELGASPAYISSAALNPSLITAHSQTLAGLSANTTYHYIVKSMDAASLKITRSALLTRIPILADFLFVD